MVPRRSSGNNLPLDPREAYRRALGSDFNVKEVFGSKMGLFIEVNKLALLAQSLYPTIHRLRLRKLGSHPL